MQPITSAAEGSATDKAPEMIDCINSLKVMALDLSSISKVMMACANFLIEKNQSNEVSNTLQG